MTAGKDLPLCPLPTHACDLHLTLAVLRYSETAQRKSWQPSFALVVSLTLQICKCDEYVQATFHFGRA